MKQTDSDKTPNESLIHGSVGAMPTQAGYLGVIFLGPSGAGKTACLLRLMGHGGRLIADDQVVLESRGKNLWARAPARLKGMLEVPGFGILSKPSLATVPLGLAVKLVHDEEHIPGEDSISFLGHRLPLLKLRAENPALPELLQSVLDARALIMPGSPTSHPVSRHSRIHPTEKEDINPDRKPALANMELANTALANTALANTALIVTGLSGAGRTTALKQLEDIGFKTSDNLPLRLALSIIAQKEDQTPLAIGIDAQTLYKDKPHLLSILEKPAQAAEGHKRPRIVFLDCSNEILVRRYQETRHRHPIDHGESLEARIEEERERLEDIKAKSDYIIDTSHFSPKELLEKLETALGAMSDHAAGERMAISLLSFSYRGGIPLESDFVVDVRFLPNPHYVPQLQPLDGRNQEVADYVLQGGSEHEFLERLYTLFSYLLPRYYSEGKSYFTLAFGCTGGKHRSVAVAERFAAWLRHEGYRPQVHHRDVLKTSKIG